MNSLDWAWVAGLLEGEGCFTFSSNGYPRIQLQMTDEDIVSRIANYFDVSYRLRKSKNPKHKDSFELAIIKTEKLIECYIELFPLLGKRRQQKIQLFHDFWITKRHKGIPNMSISIVTESTHNV